VVTKAFPKRFDFRAGLPGDENDRNVLGTESVERRSRFVEVVGIAVE
jgi:hypothetical protein